MAYLIPVPEHDLQLIGSNIEPLIDSRLLANKLGVQHRHLLRRIELHQSDYMALGVMRFESAKAQKLGGRPERFALLNEDQGMLVLTYTRNTPEIRAMKTRLIQAFGEARRTLAARDQQYLPSYRHAHQAASQLAEYAQQHGSSTPAKMYHINLEKLVNKTIGIDKGQRSNLSTAQLTTLGCCYVLAAESVQYALATGADHKQAYQAVKAKLAIFKSLFLPVGLLEG
ncbi:Rha family transcriptional regulator [uncultured Deefgea sp.]|uniref:Rha family transcriptional regulator n=1 Tax=uncultured Deefgea sp. TaxID=1304914 RepID=UPI00260A31EB|nr:Rha family transcriptional regulator [uncultured Deefgea sp.]